MSDLRPMCESCGSLEHKSADCPNNPTTPRQRAEETIRTLVEQYGQSMALTTLVDVLAGIRERAEKAEVELSGWRNFFEPIKPFALKCPQCASTADNVVCQMCRGTTWVLDAGKIATAVDRATSLDPVVRANIDRLRQRSERGVSKYGTTLADASLSQSDLLAHLRDELLDAANYVEAAIRLRGNDG